SEFPAYRRKGGWAVIGADPWTDWQGHGTMCMTIAAASKANGRNYVGVAPDAGLYACRSHFYDSELAAIYDFLVTRAEAGEKIVASNSFGVQTGMAPTPDPNSDFLPALGDAIAAGVFVAFSAGNYHQLAGGQPDRCAPTSIWLHKCRNDVMTVATCDLDRAMWFYSSRGKGQHFGDPGTSAKPDVTAPTPRNGKILYGSGEKVLQDGWGTSGACPQVAGLAAQMWELAPDMTAEEIRDTIRKSASDLGFAHECQGAGLIDCNASATSVLLG
ncbi:MAG TPA: S8 family serine peptidase, partial [Rhizobiaceae bacterium]|nr:S8 family serine peptidase [Rhizobiaceae bacterium]